MNSENKVGRPSVMTPQVIAKLEEGFAYGFSDLEACFYAGISKSSLYEYQNQNPEFTERKEALKKHVSMRAKMVIHEAVGSGDKQAAEWHLERRDKDQYSTKVESEVKDVTPPKIEFVEAGDED